MKPGQVTVLGLVLVLLALEGVRNPTVKNFLKSALSNFRGAINSASGGKPTSAPTSAPTSTPAAPPKTVNV